MEHSSTIFGTGTTSDFYLKFKPSGVQIAQNTPEWILCASKMNSKWNEFIRCN